MRRQFVSSENAVMDVFSDGDEVRFRRCDGAHWSSGKVLDFVDPGDESEGHYKITAGGKVYSIPLSRVTYKEHGK
jgi:hypothetical protein